MGLYFFLHGPFIIWIFKLRALYNWGKHNLSSAVTYPTIEPVNWIHTSRGYHKMKNLHLVITKWQCFDIFEPISNTCKFLMYEFWTWTEQSRHEDTKTQCNGSATFSVSLGLSCFLLFPCSLSCICIHRSILSVCFLLYSYLCQTCVWWRFKDGSNSSRCIFYLSVFLCICFCIFCKTLMVAEGTMKVPYLSLLVSFCIFPCQYFFVFATIFSIHTGWR